VLRYRTGVAGSAAAGQAIAKYLTGETLKPENEALAKYYAGETVPEPETGMDDLGRAIAEGEVSFTDVVYELSSAHVRMFGLPEDDLALDMRIGDRLIEAANKYDMQQAVAAEGGTVAGVRQDMDPRLAERLGIDTARPLTQTEIAHLLTGLRADGQAVQGKQHQRPMRSVAAVFGLDEKRLPSPGEIGHVLAGKRGDGAEPREVAGHGAPLSDTVIQGARRRFLTAYGVASGREPTDAQIAAMKAGRTANGGGLDASNVMWKLNATKSPISHIDMIWSADKSVSIAWALAPTEAERAIILQAHKHAVTASMAYAEDRLGYTTKGKGGKDGTEKGVTTWLTFDHYTARPTAEFARVDKDGQVYTEFQDVPMRKADMQLHTHATWLQQVLTPNGRIGSMDLDRLDGLVKELGAIYQASLARNLRAHGIETRLDPKTGAAVVTAVPQHVGQHFSKRSQDVQAAARAYASAEGLDWDSLSPERQLGLLRKGVEETRHEKGNRDGPSDFVEWREQAKAEIGYRHRSVLRPDDIKPELTQDQRHVLAYRVSLDLIEEALSKRAKLGSQDFRECAARGLVEAGISDKPAEDIKAVMRMYNIHGVRQNGEMTKIWFGKDLPVRGKERWSVTTDMHVADERALIQHAKKFSNDYSGALSPAALERASRAFLAKNPKIDPTGDQWLKQRAVIEQAGTGPRFNVIVGVGGSGKSTMLLPLVTAMREDGQAIHGLSRGWKQAVSLKGAGLTQKDVAAVSVFLDRVEKGRIKLNAKSTVIIEEMSQTDRSDVLKLQALQEKHGFRLLGIADPKQGGSIDPGVIDLLVETLGDKVPTILTSVRAITKREREISRKFRDGEAHEAIAMKIEDGTARLIAGGRDATISAIADKWQELTTADPTLVPTIGISSNRDAHDIGLAIRQQLQASGKVGPDQIRIGVLQRGEDGVHHMPLAEGDKVRVFNRVWMNGHFASNGDIIDVVNVSTKGMTARNEEGHQAFVPWEKFQGAFESTPRLAYGHALTIDASQGVTSRIHFDAILSGSWNQQGGKGYVNESRQVEATLMFVNEAAERKKIFARMPRGQFQPIREADIWKHVGDNLARPTNKASAVDFLKQGTDLRQGSTQALPTSHEHAERLDQRGYNRTQAQHQGQRLAIERSPAMRQVVSYAHAAKQKITEAVDGVTQRIRPHAPRQSPERGPSLRL
jgi:conjugative relaxase-like TrwC/TraI family protein